MIWSGSSGRRSPWVTVMYGRRETTWVEDWVIAQIVIEYLHPEWANDVHGVVVAPRVEALQLGGHTCRPQVSASVEKGFRAHTQINCVY